MTRSLGTAPSNPRLGTDTPLNTHGDEAGDGGAAPNDWLSIWVTLANRIVEWNQAVEAEEDILVFDSHDQARLA